MDFQQCFSILQSRQECEAGNHPGCAHDEARPRHEFCQELPNMRHLNISEEINEMGPLELVNLFSSLQGERVQTYTSFDKTLDVLLSRGTVEEYPALCAEITARFSTISQKIIEVKNRLKSLSHVDLSENIDKLQQLEKEKLLLVAARHLDKLRSNLPSLIPVPNVLEESTADVEGQVGSSSTSKNSRRILQIESEVSGIMEEIQSLKCDLV